MSAWTASFSVDVWNEMDIKYPWLTMGDRLFSSCEPNTRSTWYDQTNVPDTSRLFYLAWASLVLFFTFLYIVLMQNYGKERKGAMSRALVSVQERLAS